MTDFESTVRHRCRELTENEKIDIAALNDAAQALLIAIATVESHYSATPSRDLEIAKIRAEEAAMWAVKHVTR